MDEIGGTLSPTSSFSTGKVSRSLLAVFQALRSGQLDKVWSTITNSVIMSNDIQQRLVNLINILHIIIHTTIIID